MHVPAPLLNEIPYINACVCYLRPAAWVVCKTAALALTFLRCLLQLVSGRGDRLSPSPSLAPEQGHLPIVPPQPRTPSDI